MDTIASEISPSGQGAISVIRLSGEKSFEILKKLTRKKKIKPRFATVNYVYLHNNIKDRAIIISFLPESSYTGERVVEISIHGNPILVKILLELIYQYGARPAERGEFTQRAFINGKLDLSQADAVLAIINSKSYSALKHASKSLQGEIKKKINNILNKTEYLLTEFEILLINEEEDLNFNFYNKLSEIELELKKIIKWYMLCSRDFETAEILLLGPSNVGKSTLFNALLNQERAIVSKIPGTTRDIIREDIIISDRIFKLVDGVGVRNFKGNKLEEKGFQNLKKKIKDSSLLLLVFDITKDWEKEKKTMMELFNNKEYLVVFNKVDKLKKKPNNNLITISAKKNINIDFLLEKISEKFNSIDNNKSINSAFVSKRTFELCKIGLNNLEKTKKNIKKYLFDIAAYDLNNMRKNLKEILGENVSPGDIVSFFDRFCVGK